MKVKIVLIFMLVLCIHFAYTAAPWQGKGRIAISSDGNEHDHDDWAATPFSLALLAAAGLQEQMVLYTYSDHVWGSNHEHPPRSNRTQVGALQEMRISALEGADWFGFDRSRFIEAVANPGVAYDAMAAQINASSAQNPLLIIAAGPMHVVGTALNRSQVSKRQYVTVISHSLWNDRHSDKPYDWESHSGWTWVEMENTFSKDGVTFLHIVDQNGGTGYDGMQADIARFNWIKTSAARNHSAYKPGSWDWLYSRQETVVKGGRFDPSDAGMIIYMLTGIEKTNPEDAKRIMENPVTNNGSSSSSSSSSSSNPSSSSAATPGNINDLQLVQVDNIGSAVQLQWSDTQAETGYRIRRKLITESQYTNLTDVAANATTFLDQSVQVGQTYIYMVRPLVNGVAVALSNTPQITVSAQSSSSSSSSSSPSSSSQELSGYFFIQHKISGKRIRPYNDLEASAIVTAPESWSGNWVQWKMVNSDNGFFYLQNKVTGMYFRPNSGAEGSELVARPQDWSGNWTQWQLEQGTDGYMHIKNRGTAMYFAPTGSGDLSTSDYGIATTSWANEATQWQMVPVSALNKKGFAQNDLHKNNEVNVLFGASGVSMQWQQPNGYATVQVMGLDGAVLFAQNITHPYQMSIPQSVLGQSNLFIIRLSGTAGEWHSGLINSK